MWLRRLKIESQRGGEFHLFVGEDGRGTVHLYYNGNFSIIAMVGPKYPFTGPTVQNGPNGYLERLRRATPAYERAAGCTLWRLILMATVDVDPRAAPRKCLCRASVLCEWHPCRTLQDLAREACLVAALEDMERVPWSQCRLATLQEDMLEAIAAKL